MAELQKEVAALLDKANFVHLSTLMPDGAPHSDPVWVLREDNRIYVGTGEKTLKAKNTRRDPRVALSIVDRENPYEEAQLRGRVVEHREDNDLKIMDRISHKYTGKDFPFGRGGPGRVALIIEIEQAHYLKLPF